MIRVRQATKKGWIGCCEGGVADLSYPNSKLRRGRVQGGGQICPTITQQGGLHRLNSVDIGKYRIRKLTPRECSVLMGLTFEDDDKAADVGISASQRYKTYGNGIVTDCVKLIFEHLYKAQYDQDYVCSDENFCHPQIIV